MKRCICTNENVFTFILLIFFQFLSVLLSLSLCLCVRERECIDAWMCARLRGKKDGQWTGGGGDAYREKSVVRLLQRMVIDDVPLISWVQ